MGFICPKTWDALMDTNICLSRSGITITLSDDEVDSIAETLGPMIGLCPALSHLFLILDMYRENRDFENLSEEEKTR